MKPSFKIEVNGKDIGEKTRALVQAIDASDESGFESDSMSVVFKDKPGLNIPSGDEKISLYLGYDNDLWKIGDYTVSDISGEMDSYVRIVARGVDMQSGLKVLKTRVYDSQRLSEVFREIATSNSLKAYISSAVEEIIVNKQIVQANQSDLSFLTTYCKDYDLIYKIQNDEILIHKKNESIDKSGNRPPAQTIRRQDGYISMSYNIRGRKKYQSAIAVYRDIEQAKSQEIVIGDREPVYRFDRIFSDKLEAEQAARSILKDYQYDSFAVTIKMNARSGIVADGKINLTGFKRDLDQSYRVKTVRHSLRSRYDMSLSLEMITE